ncbi:CheA like protein [Synechocystis sp. PCC 6803]|uniref:histidine kinase n=1 Tax=Synechocystis sp. (strain ATCC 27184 / PCC 6803 / Kazusa) TaxID=1111708 RepID=P73172_SYNY3|nr:MULTISPECIES: hybrid sensor histidine kinase/response regulator [unclassified Synechocystis]BAM50917.1 chemotaxis protein CheA [Synechocystis sp. PCC 6803] [Bacillus subtilis BEST7613]AGF50888.1 CheA like protein [Synechocystis sp. PCC 6803]ALJ66936.1 chemotaxis protein CheA [Synechocystis sp. PCC 6803]AVP88779.1 hybrid sensor histidine kinase/response regulator [Synechocystis sp. IPPAS B-1465]MBD2617289.1 hybrid sensor histidine kinase/response regulator [Synechocystis sp. FACHB-898]
MFDAATLAAITAEARQAFLEEDAPECLAQLTVGFQSLERVLGPAGDSQQRQKLIQDMGRAAHSLKGGAGMSALTPLQTLCHRLEDLFEALEQGRVEDKSMAVGLIAMTIEETQAMVELANSGRLQDTDEPPELALALGEFLETCQPQPSQEEAIAGDVSQFVRTSLTVELEACLERVERRLERGGTATELRESFSLLLEECTLLGQALSCDWLEEAGNRWRGELVRPQVDLLTLLPTAIAELRSLREQFLAGELTPPAPEIVAEPDPEPLPEVKPVTAVIAPPVPGVPIPAVVTAKASPAPSTRQTLRIPLDRLNKLSNTVSELLINQERLLEYDKQLRQASRNLKRRGQQLIPMREQVESLYDELSFSDQTKISPSNGGGNQNGDSQSSLGIAGLVDFDALEMDSYTAVHGILQRFQELMVQVQEIQEDVDLVERDLQETLIQMSQSLHQLDSELTQSRLVPFRGLAQSFAQPLEKLGDRHKKPVQFVIEGENTLVEVAILDQLRTPLTHLIRNAFDHGLEFVPERQAQGKLPEGTITLSASTANNQVLITVSDDGRGIDPEKISRKAMELGWLTPEQLGTIGEAQMLDFLFQPGFSTAAEVSNLSGRGLGLDIVKQMIESLRGTLTVETKLGQGSRFLIRIPLSLNIVPLLLVRYQQRLLAFPSESVLRILPLDDYPIKNGRVEWQSQIMEACPLDEVLPQIYPQGFSPSPGLPHKVGLMVNLGDRSALLTVEQIVDERTLVVKALDAITPIPSYVAGCTVLGTGEVVPVLIPNNFAVLWRTEPTLPQDAAGSAGGQTTILVIDDSVTVRRTLQRVLGGSFRLIQCRDGKEAWDLLNRQNQGIDLALCDIEMPNMDGFSLLQLVRAHRVWHSLTVVMLTSRENPLHRNRAKALGADGYLTKPFQPNQLLSTIDQFLAESAQR